MVNISGTRFQANVAKDQSAGTTAQTLGVS